MSYILAVANQKGGVGKTTTSINLAAAFTAMQRKVLLIDLDPQGNATTGSGMGKASSLKYDTKTTLCGESSAAMAIVATPNAYDLLPSNQSLIVAEVHLMNLKQRELQLRNSLASQQAYYDLMIIDCPPALNILTVNALVAANALLIPVQCEYFALEGLGNLLRTVTDIRSSINPDLQIAGVLRTLYDGRNRLSLEISQQLIKHFNDQVYNTVIPRNVRLAEAPSHGMAILHYDEKSSGAIAYLALAGEILRRTPALVRSNK